MRREDVESYDEDQRARIVAYERGRNRVYRDYASLRHSDVTAQAGPHTVAVSYQPPNQKLLATACFDGKALPPPEDFALATSDALPLVEQAQNALAHRGWMILPRPLIDATVSAYGVRAPMTLEWAQYQLSTMPDDPAKRAKQAAVLFGTLLSGYFNSDFKHGEQEIFQAAWQILSEYVPPEYFMEQLSEELFGKRLDTWGAIKIAGNPGLHLAQEIVERQKHIDELEQRIEESGLIGGKTAPKTPLLSCALGKRHILRPVAPALEFVSKNPLAHLCKTRHAVFVIDRRAQKRSVKTKEPILKVIGLPEKHAVKLNADWNWETGHDWFIRRVGTIIEIDQRKATPLTEQERALAGTTDKADVLAYFNGLITARKQLEDWKASLRLLQRQYDRDFAR